MTGLAYPINVLWSDEDQSWVANAPDLEFCSAIGYTAHEAVAELETAIQAWVDAAISSGNSVPPPSSAKAKA